uniref:Protein TIC 214 n=1 Tax=Helixanthera parasitica TaxID=227895 RepID=A0A344KYQ5_9MAGN|nr:ycf1 protein [Helixanthera parasitica]AXB38541.1 ycf1 protein [Helixanthera parasitica]
MILKSFLLGNLVSLCMKIINSVVVVGLYYGFLTTFSIGPSYLFLLRAPVMEERKEGTEKKVSAITGFITGQLMMLISIYYAPLHLALGRPHTITVLALPYLLFHFFWNNHTNFLVYGSITRNSMRNLSIQCIFLNNIIFQFLNHFILPSSMLARLVNIFMFRCNNKMLFVTSSFFGWLIGHILFMKWILLVLVWIGQNHSIRSNVLIRFNKYIMSKLQNLMARIFSILLFITCVYHLGRIPSPILTKKLKKTSEMKGIQKESQDVFTEEDPFSEKRGALEKIDETKEIEDELHFIKAICSLDENKDNLKAAMVKNVFWFEKPPVTLIFDYKRWNYPLRYIKNDQFENAVRNEMSQYFFYICQSDGKLKISFTYLLSLVNFFEMIQRKISLNELAFDSNKLYNYWIYNTQHKNNKQINETINRIEALDKELLFIDILEKKTRLCNCDKKKEYLPKIYDPLLNRPFDETLQKKRVTPLNETFAINKIHGILFNESRKFEHKISYDKKLLLLKKTNYLLTLINEFSKEPTPSFNLQRLILFPKKRKGCSKELYQFFKFLFHVVIKNNHKKSIIKKSDVVKGIRKKLSYWSYKLIDELEQQERVNTEDRLAEDHGIRSRKTKRVIIFTDKQTNTEDVALIHYSHQSDFRRDIIKGSRRTQRRKTVIWELFQTNLHSPLFLERKDNKRLFLYFKIYELIKFMFRNAINKNAQLKLSDYKEEGIGIKEMTKNQKYKIEERTCIEIAETWDTIPLAQAMRGCMLVTQSSIRKYIILPSLIITKNIIRMLLFQFPEWSEDLNQWNREIHVKCTYNGVQLSEREFPKNWLTDGIQIKIIFPFHLKPWYRSKLRSLNRNTMKTKRNKKKDFFYLTIWGMEAEMPFGPPRKRPPFCEPIFKRLEKKIIKFKKIYFAPKRFIIMIMNNERTHLGLLLLKDKIIFLKFFITNEFFRKTKNFLKSNKIFKLKKKKSHPSQTKKEKDYLIKNHRIYESSIQKKSKYSKKDLSPKNKIKDLIDKTKKIKKERTNIFFTIRIFTNQKKNNKRVDRIKFKFTKLPKRLYGILKKKKNSKFIYESKFFFFKIFKFFIEKIYINSFRFISSIKILSINVQLFIQSIQKSFEMIKYIYNNKKKNERVEQTKKITIRFISTIKHLLNNNINNNKNSTILFGLSSLSQTYVFYKLSQIQINYLDKLRYVLQYHETSVFSKNVIQKFFRTQRILHCDAKLRHKKFLNYDKKKWQGCLKDYYHYDLLPIIWSRLVPQKWRNRVNQHSTIQTKELNNEYLSEQSSLIHHEKTLVSDQNFQFKKHYRYDLLSYLYYNSNNYNYENKAAHSISMSKSPLKEKFQVTKKITFINFNTDKTKLLDKVKNIHINNFLNNYRRYDNIRNRDKKLNTKYFDCQILFILKKKKVYIFDKKSFFYLTQNEILSKSRSNMELWFLQKFLQFFNDSRINPCAIPIKSFFFFNVFNESTKKKKFISLDEKKNTKYKNNIKTEFDIFIKRYLLFQLRWDNLMKQKIINNIKVYCFLLRLINPKEMAISSIRREEMSMDIMLIQNKLTCTKSTEGGILILEPIRLSIKKNIKFFIYKIVCRSCFYKNKHQTNQRTKTIFFIDKNKSTTQHQNSSVNKNYNFDDLFVPETILSSRRCREFRILICLNLKKKKNCNTTNENKKLMKLKFFIWTNFRLEDFTCINRYWFDTNNSICFSMLRIRMYPQLKIC